SPHSHFSPKNPNSRHRHHHHQQQHLYLETQLQVAHSTMRTGAAQSPTRPTRYP
ncbi:hypothetical protein CFP56_037798, partial [Quercus suber]